MTDGKQESKLSDWELKLREALNSEDPHVKSEIDSGQKLLGHSIFARLNSDSPRQLEVVPASVKPSEPNELRLILTHQPQGRTDGEHVVVIGMNPSKARALTGRFNLKGEIAENHMPETDNTAATIRGWLESEELKNTQRLTIINLVPIIKTNSGDVQSVVDSWTGPDLKDIFRRTLDAVLSVGTTKNVRIICAWGSPTKKWVRNGKKWFDQLISEHLPEYEIKKLKYNSKGKETTYPPHPLYTRSLRNGNELIPYDMEE